MKINASHNGKVCRAVVSCEDFILKRIGPRYIKLNKAYRATLTCGHVEVRKNIGNGPPEKLLCSTCRPPELEL